VLDFVLNLASIYIMSKFGIVEDKKKSIACSKSKFSHCVNYTL